MTGPEETRRRIAKVGRYHLYLFLLPVISVLYYGWLTASQLNERADNPQRVAPLARRGRILDHLGAPLAHNVHGEREYPLGEAAGSLVGYQLRGKNQTGLEAALQAKLSPPLPPAGLAAALEQDQEVKRGVHGRLMGPDITLTLDAGMQRALYDAIQPLSGAIAVVDSEGRILAAVSSPSFDSNSVGEQWQKLRSDPRSPFIERVGSGLYPVTLAGELPLMSPDNLEYHWFSDDPFPGYPLDSSAAWIEGRLFVTPLMLVELAFQLAGQAETPSPSLLPGDSIVRRPLPAAPDLVPDLKAEGVLVWALQGPRFRESPEFLVLMGEVQPGPHYFSVVLESAGSPAREVLEQKVLPAIVKQVRTQHTL